MKLLVGLGNPGPKYETTRHNAGFLILDEIAEKFGVTWTGEKFFAICGKGQVFGSECVLIKPQTFMNVSGKAVRAAQQFFKIAETDVIVLHDEVDLEPGAVRARVGGGPGGHNGIRSIIAEAGIQNFHRIKIGVGKPKELKDGQVKDWVLNQFTDDELLVLQEKVFNDVLVRLENIFKQNG